MRFDSTWSVLFILGASVSFAQSDRENLASRLPNLSPEDQAFVQSIYDFTIAGLETARLGEVLKRFDLDDDTVGTVLSARLEEAFADSTVGLSRDLVFAYATDVIAESFADIMLQSSYAQRLPQKLRNPFHALFSSTVKEGFGVAETIVFDSATVGPFALAFPIVDRFHDVVEIRRTANAAVDDRNDALLAASLGAEVNAELLTKYPSLQSSRVASQWLADTLQAIEGISNEQEYQQITVLLEQGFDALVAVKSGECTEACKAAIARLRSATDNGGAAAQLNPLTPTETALRVAAGYDPVQSLAEGMLELTFLQTEGLLPSAPYYSVTNAVLAVSEEEVLEEPEQRARLDDICDRYRSGTEPVTGQVIAEEVQGLTDYYRRTSISCMTTNRDIEVTAVTLRQLLQGFNESERQTLLCSFRDSIDTPLDAQTMAALLEGTTGWYRGRGISCLEKALGDTRLSVADAMEVLGNLMPEQYPGWDETLANYDPAHHLRGLCALADHLSAEIGADDAARLLGQSRNYERSQGLRCIRDSIQHGLTWDDVDKILGPSIDYRGTMIDALEERAPDGLNERKLEDFLDRYKNRRYLNLSDAPTWLKGQCIAFARLAWNEVTGGPIDIQFEQASNIVKGSASAGLATVTDPAKARVGALAVWDNGGAGHVAVVTKVYRNRKTGLADRIQIAESNWGIATSRVERIWGLSIEEAKREDVLVTDRYGFFDTKNLRVDQMDRPAPDAEEPLSYRFVGYVIP